MAVVKRKPKQPPRSALAELDQLVSIVSRLEANCRDNWAQLNAWHNNPANDVQALAARVDKAEKQLTLDGTEGLETLRAHSSLIEGLNTRIDEGLGEVQAAIVDLDRRVNSAEPETRDRITKLRYDHNQLAMEIREVYRRELDEVKAQLGEWSRENKMDNLTVEYRLKRLAEDWDGDGLTKTVIALREEIRDVKDRLGGWPPETAGAPDTFLRPTGNRRLIILNVRWPTGTSQGERIGPLAVRADDIYRIVPLTNPGRCEVEVQMPGLVGGDAGSIRNDTVGPVLFTFVVEGEFAEIVARINA